MQLFPEERAARRRFYEACAALNGNVHFGVIIEAIKNHRKGVDHSASRTKDDVVVRWLQGRSQLCDEIIESVESGAERAREMR